MTREEKFMMEAIALSQKAIEKREGGPFGCVVVKDDEIIGRGNNQVIASKDPTAHAEVVAIRDACKTLDSFQLDGCEIFTSCEPCPMCFGAIYWARPLIVYYANTHTDAANIGFDDALIYDEIVIDHKNKKIPMMQLGREHAIKVFELWANDPDKSLY
jgi:guanine deaminase